MTVDDIRKLSPEQMTRMAEIRTEIEALEQELQQIIKGDKPKRASKSRSKKKSAKKPAPAPAPQAAKPTPKADVPAQAAPQPAQEPDRSAAFTGFGGLPELQQAENRQAEDPKPPTDLDDPPVETDAPVPGVLARLALPKQAEPGGTELDS